MPEPDGEAVKVTVPLAFVAYPESPLVTVTVHFSETPTVAADGVQETEVVVVVWTLTVVEVLALERWVVSPA
jgi:hypothetical protein